MTAFYRGILVLFGAIAWASYAASTYAVQARPFSAYPFALTDGDAPTRPASRYTQLRWAPTIDDDGNVAFIAAFNGPNDAGVAFLSGPPRNESVVLASGRNPTPVTGIPGAEFSSSNSSIRNGDFVAYVGNLRNGVGGVTPFNNRGIWSGVPLDHTLVAREQDPIPDIAGAQIFNFEPSNDVALNNRGQTLFRGEFVTSNAASTYDAIWSKDGVGNALIAAEGQPAPGQGGLVFGALSDPVLNDRQQVAFSANLPVSESIWFGELGAITPVVRAGGEAPGIPGGRFTFLGEPAINNAGEIAFVGDVGGFAAVWAGRPDELRLIAMRGEPAPGLPGVSFGGMDTRGRGVLLGGNGEVLFTSVLTEDAVGASPTITTALWLGSDEGLSVVAQAGQDAPGVDAQFARMSSASYAVSNGVVVFHAGLTGDGVGANNNEGIWVKNSGVLSLLAREGDLFDVDPDPLVQDMRTIRSVWFSGGSGGEDGRGQAVNRHGQIVFGLGFEDGTQGLFLVEVPEPNSLLPLWGGGVLVLCRRPSRFGDA